jgi:ABC-type transporter Mla MlaB component
MAQPHPARIVVDAAVLAADAATLDLLARMQLAARRLGRYVSLRDPSRDLQRLIAFAGLEEALRVEPPRQAEEREQPLGAEEERQLLDPPG